MPGDPERGPATQIFLKARELDPDARPRFLDEACVGDAELRADIESLLAHDHEPPPCQPPTIKNYQVLGRIGVGGMGEVYEARQQGPLGQRLALKVIKPGMDTHEVVARFESERQALALMEHPNIARIYDAGATEQGRPYFVMEFVPGVPITTYCDIERMGELERIHLFLIVCEAVHHAHQKGVIHRDLKPPNILVMLVDDKPVPKIIDFGVAKATTLRLTERTLFTEAGVMIGTPEYMPPEQAEMTRLDVDTRADVYSLGVLLYEVLVGDLPFNKETFRQSGLDEIRRVIREEDPARPSTRVSSMGGEAATAVAKRRRTDPVSLASFLRGDLDWIIMKTLEKERARRYGSVSDLAADIVRYLNHQAVLASPPSRVYRLTKFVRRHRIGVGFAAALVLFLTTLTINTTTQASRVKAERDRANLEAASAEQVSEFLIALFKQPDPLVAQGRELTAREILDRGAVSVRRDLKDQIELQARFLDTIGRVYLSLGRLDDARSLIVEALDLRRSRAPDHPLEFAASLQSLGNLQNRTGEYEEATKTLGEALAIRTRLLGDAHQDVGNTLSDLAESYWYLNDLEKSKEMYERVLGIRRKGQAVDDPEVAATMKDLADIAFFQGRYAEARPLYEGSLKTLERTVGAHHPRLIPLLTNLGSMLFELRRYEAARPHLWRAMELSRAVQGSDHPDLAGPLNNYGRLLLHDGALDQAKATFEEARRITEGRLGKDHPDVAMSLDNLGWAYLVEGKYRTAEDYLSRALAIWESRLGRDSLDAAMTLNRLADLRRQTGDLKGAQGLYEEVLKVREEKLPPVHPEIADTLEGYAKVLREKGAIRRSEELSARAARIWESLAAKP